MDTPIIEAIKAVGGQGAMARLLNVSRGLVSQWAKGRRPVAAHHVLLIEQASGISRHRLSASVFGPAPSSEPDTERTAVRVLVDSRLSKRALRARLGFTSDAHLAKVLQLPVEQVTAWPEEQGVPALPQVLQLLGAQEQPAAGAAPNDPDAERVIQVQVA
jgi:DNA-binding transcriptional regulator YiaG